MKTYFSKPYMSYLAVLSFGVNLAFNFQLTYLSSVFKFFGAEAGQLSFLWLAPAITGLIVQPVIGQLSDASTMREKRRPYAIGSGILAVLSFCLIPHANNLFQAVILIWILNASVNGCLAMWRALTTDLSPPEERAKTFSYHAFLGGVGTAIGVSLPYLTDKFFLLIGKTPVQNGKLPTNLSLSFIVSGVLLALTLLVSMIKVKEPPNENTLQQAVKKEREKVFFKFTVGIFIDLAKDFKTSSFKFKKLCLLNSITALGVFIFWIYFILALAQNFYSLPIGLSEANMSAEAASILQKATSASSGYLSICQLTNTIYALFLFFLLERTDKTKLIHGISLLIGGAGLVVMGLANKPALLVTAMIAMGMLIASFGVLPYVIVSHIFPKGKTGIYYGLFNVSITLSQALGALTLSPAYLSIFGGRGSYMMFLAGGLALISAVLWLREAYSSRPASTPR